MKNKIEALKHGLLVNQNRLMVAAVVLGGAAGAQSTAGEITAAKSAGAAAVTEMQFQLGVAAFSGGASQAVKENQVGLIVAMIPVMIWYFIRSNVRGIV